MLTHQSTNHWTLPHKLLFRFFFIFFALSMVPWNWLDDVPGVESVTRWYTVFIDCLVREFNRLLFHVREDLVYYNGSGDTSFGWAELCLNLLLASVGTLVWSIADRRRENYIRLNYWLCLFARYYVAQVALNYGIIKLFSLQMAYPNLSQLATPLGDFLPMRLSWMFIGYSRNYQFFSGLMEVLSAVLLLYRRTATLGVMLALVVFSNVFIMNLSYDIPVKIFSGLLVLVCLFLLVNEWNRISCFFIHNRPADACTLYHFNWSSKKWRIGRIAFKTVFLIVFMVLPFSRSLDWYRSRSQDATISPAGFGVYAVESFILNNDSLPVPVYENERWQEMIFDRHGQGSIRTADSSFRRQYNRAYFNYVTDTLASTIELRRMPMDSLPLAKFSYQRMDSVTLELNGAKGNDSIRLRISRMPRHFQLTENQFHWLSEANR